MKSQLPLDVESNDLNAKLLPSNHASAFDSSFTHIFRKVAAKLPRSFSSGVPAFSVQWSAAGLTAAGTFPHRNPKCSLPDYEFLSVRLHKSGLSV